MKFILNQKFFALFLFACTLSVIVGCNNEEGINSYTVDKPEKVQQENHVENTAADAPAAPAMAKPSQPPAGAAQAGKPARMFAAHVPQGNDVWYYKMTGPVEAVEALVEPLAKFVSSVKYEQGKASWKLPEGWKQNPGGGMRFATLEIPSDAGPLELAVFRLNNGPDEVAHAAANINRWRGQLGLPGITTDDVKNAGDDITKPTSKKKIGDQTIYFVNIVGKKSSQGMRPPFAR